jgi:hypothetical protein
LRAVKVKLQAGGGGGGGSATNNNTGGGGGGGAYSEKFVTDISSLSSSETVTVGAAGTGGAAGANNGTNGGTSSFGAIVVCGGGDGGQSSAGTFQADTGGKVTTAGDLNIDGQPGVARVAGAIGALSNGGSSFLGFGAQHVPVNSNINAQPALAGYGGGGAGALRTTINSAGGDGRLGIVIIELYL